MAVCRHSRRCSTSKIATTSPFAGTSTDAAMSSLPSRAIRQSSLHIGPGHASHPSFTSTQDMVHIAMVYIGYITSASDPSATLGHQSSVGTDLVAGSVVALGPRLWCRGLAYTYAYTHAYTHACTHVYRHVYTHVCIWLWLDGVICDISIIIYGPWATKAGPMYLSL